MTRTTAALLLFTVVLAEGICALAQDRKFTEGRLAGFTESTYEHIISTLEEPILVRKAEGRITLRLDGTALHDAIFEVRLPGTGKVVGTRTNKCGHFELKLKSGTYLFKVTKDGFGSIVGTLIVSKDAQRSARVSIEMEPGA